MNADQRPRTQVSMPVNSHEDEKHLIDYLRVLYKRRWVAIPDIPRDPRRRCHQHLPDHADLRGARPDPDREGLAAGRRSERHLHAAGRLVQRRVLSDPVPDPAKPQPRAQGGENNAARQPSRLQADDLDAAADDADGRGHRRVLGRENGDRRRGPERRAARDDPAADGVGRDRAGSAAGRYVPRRADRGASPQQPPGGAPLHVERAAAGRRHGQRAGEDLHRAEPRVQVPLLEGRDRLAVGADGRAAEEGRGERGRSCSATRSSTTRSPSRIARTSSCSVSAR